MQRIESTDANEELLVAAEAGNLKRVTRLLKRGANVNYADDLDYTALAYAVENNHEAVVLRLLEKEGIDTTLQVQESLDSIGGSPLHIAAFRGYDNIVRMLVNAAPTKIDEHEYCGYTPLHETIVNGQYSTFKLLLNLGASCLETTEENNVDTPEGLDALELIMHELTGFSSRKITLIKMLVYLIRNYDAGPPDKQFFKEDKELYRLVCRHYKDPLNLHKELLSFFNITNEALKKESMNDIFGDYQELSDSDSEDDESYRYADPFNSQRETVEKNIAASFSQTGAERTLIPHARGVHFYPSNFGYKGKRLERHLVKEQARGSIPRQSIFCDAAHELAAIPYQLPDCDRNSATFSGMLAERSQRLAIQGPAITAAIEHMRSQQNVEACLTQTTRSYDSRLHEFTQRYVNAYAALKKDMQQARDIDITKIKSKKNKEKFILLKQLGFTKLPFVSTTEDPHWAFEYAQGLVCYDKQSTFKPTTKTSIQPARPCYLPNGQPRFPYLGVVYATLHLASELESGMSERILDLFAEDAIDTRCAAPGGHVTGGYIRAKERIFVNVIDASRVFVALIVRVPNLYHPYQPFMQEKYGLTEVEFNKFKADLAKSGTIEPGQKLRNEKQFFRTQLKIMEKVSAYQEGRLLTFLSGCARRKDFELKMLGSTSDELIDPLIRTDEEERNYIKKFVALRKEAKERSTSAGSALAAQSVFVNKGTKRKAEEDIQLGDPPLKKPRKK